MANKDNTTYQSADVDEAMNFNFFDVLNSLYTNRYMIAIVALAIPSFVGLWTFFFHKPTYDSQVTININLANKNSKLDSPQWTSFYQDQEITKKLHLVEQTFSSPKFAQALLAELEGVTNHSKKYGIDPHQKLRTLNFFFDGKTLSEAEKMAQVMSGIKYHQDKSRYDLVVSGSYATGPISATMTNLAAITLLEINHKTLVSQIKGVKGFLTEQTKSTERQLHGLESRLVRLQKKHKILSTDQVSMHANNFQIQQAEMKLELRKKIIANSMVVKELEKELNSARTSISKGKKPSYLFLTQIQRRLDLLKYQKALTKNDAQADPGEQQSIDRSISSALGDFKKAFESGNGQPVSLNPWEYIQKLELLLVEQKRKIHALNSEMEAHDKAMSISDDEFVSLPTVLQTLATLKRQIDLTANLYAQLQGKLQETEIKEAGHGNDLVLLSMADIPGKPTGIGWTKKMSLSMFGGVAVGIFLFMLKFLFFPTVRNQVELQKGGFIVLGNMPLVQWYKNKIFRKKRNKELLVIDESPDSFEANSIRVARFELEKTLDLHHIRGRGQGKVITITSVNPNEGKSFMTSNLGHALSLVDFKVALLDLDLDKPDLKTYFNTKPLNDKFELKGKGVTVSFNLNKIKDNLHLIDPEDLGYNACDYLDSELFEEFMNNLRSIYDVILIDTPPLEGYLEPMLAGQVSDAFIFVANQRSTLKEELNDFHHKILRNFDGVTMALINFAFDRFRFPHRAKMPNRKTTSNKRPVTKRSA